MGLDRELRYTAANEKKQMDKGELLAAQALERIATIWKLDGASQQESTAKQ